MFIFVNYYVWYNIPKCVGGWWCVCLCLCLWVVIRPKHWLYIIVFSYVILCIYSICIFEEILYRKEKHAILFKVVFIFIISHIKRKKEKQKLSFS